MNIRLNIVNLACHDNGTAVVKSLNVIARVLTNDQNFGTRDSASDRGIDVIEEVLHGVFVGIMKKVSNEYQRLGLRLTIGQAKIVNLDARIDHHVVLTSVQASQEGPIPMGHD